MPSGRVYPAISSLLAYLLVFLLCMPLTPTTVRSNSPVKTVRFLSDRTPPEQPVPLPSDLRDRVANRVNNPATHCREFIQKIIREAARLKGKAYSEDPLKIFNRIQREGGFHLRVQEDSGNSNFTSNGKRLVYINQVSETNDPRIINQYRISAELLPKLTRTDPVSIM